MAGDLATALFTAVRPGYEPTFAATADAVGRFAVRRKIVGGSSVANGIQRLRDGSDAILYSTPFSRRNPLT